MSENGGLRLSWTLRHRAADGVLVLPPWAGRFPERDMPRRIGIGVSAKEDVSGLPCLLFFFSRGPDSSIREAGNLRQGFPTRL